MPVLLPCECLTEAYACEDWCSPSQRRSGVWNRDAAFWAAHSPSARLRRTPPPPVSRRRASHSWWGMEPASVVEAGHGRPMCAPETKRRRRRRRRTAVGMPPSSARTASIPPSARTGLGCGESDERHASTAAAAAAAVASSLVAGTGPGPSLPAPACQRRLGQRRGGVGGAGGGAAAPARGALASSRRPGPSHEAISESRAKYPAWPGAGQMSEALFAFMPH